MDIINLTHSSYEHNIYNYYETTTTFHTSYYDYYEFIPNFYTPHNDYSERLSIFLIAAVCVGLPCLIWAFYSVHRLRKAKGGISAFIILLLLTDLLQLLLYPYIVAKLLSNHHYSYFFYYFYEEIFFIIAAPVFLKMCSLHLQQLVALEGVLTVKYPTISAHMFSSPCYIMISIIILLIPILCVVLFFNGVPYEFMAFIAIGLILAPMCLLVVTGIIVYKAPPTASSTPVNHRPGANVFILSLFTLLVLYLPCVLLCCMFTILGAYGYLVMCCIVMALCLLSLTVISEPLLCVLVCRENLSTQKKRTQIEVNAEETTV